MASARMIEFLLALPLSVYNFNQKIIDRQLLYSGPSGFSEDDGRKYNVICVPGYTSRGIPSYLVSFCCPALDSVCGPEIFTVQIRKDYWGRLPSVDWFSLVVDGAQRVSSFEYP